MDKTLDMTDFQPSEATFNPNPSERSTELESEFESNPAEPPLTFPCSRVEAGRALGVSDVTIGKWIKKLSEAGAAILEGDRITADGFSLLIEYQQAKNKIAFLASIPTPTVTVMPANALAVRRESSIALPSDFDDLYDQMASQYLALDEAESRTMGEFEELKAELIKSDRALALSLQQETAIDEREATIRGMKRAMASYAAENRAFAASLNRLRAEGKFAASPQEI